VEFQNIRLPIEPIGCMSATFVATDSYEKYTVVFVNIMDCHTWQYKLSWQL